MGNHLPAALLVLGLATFATAQEAGPREVRELVVSLKSTDPAVRSSAARILGEMGAASKAAVPDLVGVLADESRDVRQAAAIALGQVGPGAAPEAVPALIGTLNDKEWQVRRAAVVSLGRLKDRRAEDPLKGARKDATKSVRDAAKQSLKELKKK